MSDMGLGYDPYQDMSDGDLMSMYAQMNPQLFGDDPAKRLNYMQDLFSTIGTDLVQTAGVTNPAAEQYQAPMNQTGAIYGSDPLYASIFQAIEDGADPISAAKAAKDAGLFKGTQDDFNAQVLPVATQYAGERVKYQQDEMSWQAENGGGWTMPDGSKSKQTPLGGNDVRATASEYDLTGMNADDLFAQYQKRMGVGGPRGRVVPGQGVSMSAGPDRSGGFGWSAGAPVGTPNVPPMATPSPQTGGMSPAELEILASTPSQAVQYGNESMPKPAGGNWNVMDGIAKSILATAGNQAGPIQPRQPNTGERSDFSKKIDKLAQDSINRRVEKSKTNMVRSDANRNLMRRITALAGLLQGKFPE